MYGGEHGYTALNIASKIAKATDSDLTVIYVVEKLPERYRTRFHYTVVEGDKTLADLLHGLPFMKSKIYSKVNEITRGYGLEAEKKMIAGKTADVILEESEKGYDLVVVGSAGLKGIERFLYGSVSYEVAEYANVPVLVVKKDVDIRRMLVCTDGSESAEEAEFFAGQLAKALGAEITLLSVAPEYVEPEVAEQCDLMGKRMLMEVFGIDAGALCIAGAGVKSVREAILKEAPGYDLVVVGSRGLSKLQRVKMGHVSLAVKEKADTNVLIVRNCASYREWKEKQAGPTS
jgi:nucleotide-binding universal stress UspA family protein